MGRMFEFIVRIAYAGGIVNSFFITLILLQLGFWSGEITIVHDKYKIINIIEALIGFISLVVLSYLFIDRVKRKRVGKVTHKKF